MIACNKCEALLTGPASRTHKNKTYCLPCLSKTKKEKPRCKKCNRILTKLYRRDSATTPYYASEFLECRRCKEVIKIA